METIDVIPATIDDIKKLQEIGRRTFEKTFSSGNSDENLKVYLKESFSRNKLLAELRSESSHFYFAVLDNQIIGYLKLNTGQSQTELKDDKALEIERIYVL